MARRKLLWSPGSKDVASLANNRVSLVLLRIFRTVLLARNEVDLHEIIQPLWPVIRLEPTLLRRTLLGGSVKTPPTISRGRGQWVINIPDWATSSRKAIPEDAPDVDVQHPARGGNAP